MFYTKYFAKQLVAISPRIFFVIKFINIS